MKGAVPNEAGATLCNLGLILFYGLSGLEIKSGNSTGDNKSTVNSRPFDRDLLAHNAVSQRVNFQEGSE